MESLEDIIAAIAPAMTSAANHVGVYAPSIAGMTFPPSGTVTPSPAAHAPSMNAGTKRSNTRTGHSANVRLSTFFEPAAKNRWLIWGNIVTPKAMLTAVETMYCGV